MWFGNLSKNYYWVINMPISSNTIIIFKNKFLMINVIKNYFLSAAFFKKTKVFFNKNLNSIVFKNIDVNFLFYIRKFYNSTVNIIFKFFFKKFKFEGKGYYIYKNKRNSLAFQFNYSHKVNFYNKNLFINKFNKKCWILYSLNESDLINKIQDIIQLRKLNVFTNRGVRFHKQVIFLKKRNKK